MKTKLTIKQLLNLVKNKVIVLAVIKYTEYMNSVAKFKCKKCGHIWENKFQKILSGQSACSNCRYNKKRIKVNSISRILEKKNIFPLFNIEEYKNNRTTYKFKCKTCGDIFRNSIGNIILQNNGCPACNKRKKISIDVKIKELKNNNITLIKASGNVKNHMTCKCNICDYIWYPTFDAIRNKKTGCPRCLFKNERICAEVLKKLGIIACKKRISNIFYKTGLNTRKFFIVDFYFIYKGKPVILEYNGRQHYEPVNFSGKETNEEINKRFVIQKNRDIDLEKTCASENIIYLSIDGRKIFGAEHIKNVIIDILGEIK